MVRAILAGTKTQTRRLVDQRSFAGKWLADCERIGERGDAAFEGGQRGACEFVADPGNYPPYVAGMRLWVKETWAPVWKTEYAPDDIRDCDIQYRADWPKDKYPGHWPGDCGDDPDCGRWKPSLFMPRWASRLTLDVTGVRVERLQDISDDDARAEGVEAAPFCKAGRPSGMEHVEAYEDLWGAINGKKAPWDSNPFVWVVSFKKLETADA